MAQRRSKNRRLSARKSNASGFLNDDTNVYDNNDPLWYDRTAVRPSTSLCMSKNATSILDPDSTLHTSQLPDNWFENLPQSNSSKLLEEAVKRRSKQTHEPTDSDHRSAATESESEQEIQKKRANLRSVRRQSSKIDQSNAFVKALENTTESHSRNLTHAQLLEGNESESTHNESRTMKRLRPKFSKRAKNDTNNFDKALESDSASERVEVSTRSLRSSSKRISDIHEEFVTPEKQQKLRRSAAGKSADATNSNRSIEKLQNKSVNLSKDKALAETSVRELRNRNIETSANTSATPAKSTRSSGAKKRPANNQSPASSSSPSPTLKKHKRHLFSQKNKSIVEKSKGDKSAFDAALDSVNISQENEASITQAAKDSQRGIEARAADDDSDSSSIPLNIRRTRSYSVFVAGSSGEAGGANSSKNKPKAREKNSSKNVSQSSRDKLAANQSSSSDKHETSLKNSTIAESSDDEEIYSSSFIRSKETEQDKGNNGDDTKSQVSSVETSDTEDMVDTSTFKTKQSQTNKSDKAESTRLRVSSIETSNEEAIINSSASRIDQKESYTNKKANASSKKADKSRASKSTSSNGKDEDVAISSESNKGKSKSRLFQKKHASEDESTSDQNKGSPANTKAKEKEIEDTPRLSQRSPRATNKSLKNQSANASKNKSTSHESNRNDSKAYENEDDTSTIPPNIRRTRSRLFQKSKVGVDDSASANDLETSALSQKSRTLNQSNNMSATIVPDAATSTSKAGQIKPKIIDEEIVRPADSVDSSTDSPKKSQETKKPNSRKSASSSLRKKEKPVGNLQDPAKASDHRSIETSSDGTPALVSPAETAKLKRISTLANSAKSAQSSTFDDLLYTPNPAQSTLNPHGKPVDRITHFSFKMLDDLVERTPPIADEAPRAGPSTIPEVNDNADVSGVSEASGCPLISRQFNDIPQCDEKSDEHEETPVVNKCPSRKGQITRNSSRNNEEALAIDWEKARQHTDAVKIMVEAQMRLAEEARRKRELEKQRIDVKMKRLQAQREAELKRKNKKPVHKAFLVDGKVYKQPKLPRPKAWATDRLYKYLWKHMEPKFGIRTRVRSEEFVLQLSDFATRLAKRKNFEKYSQELDEIMMTMARLGVIKTRFDFYRFAADFLPYSVRKKVNPMMMPGNKRNIPYDPELLHRPLLTDSRSSQESETDES